MEFKRRMLLQYHFRHQKDKTISLFRVKSHWQPPEYTFKPLTKYFNNVLTDINKLYRHTTPNTDNMTPDDITALGEIKAMKDFVVKPADKGGKIVIWPVEQYLTEAIRQLSDTKYYAQQTIDHTRNTAYEIYTFLTHLNTNYYIDDNLFEFLSPNNPPRTPIFYVLPKIHKPNNPGCPIISLSQSISIFRLSSKTNCTKSTFIHQRHR